MENKEELWRVLNGEVNIQERLKILGVEQIPLEIDFQDAHIIEFVLRKVAYEKLLKMGEISDSEIFSIGGHTPAVHGDFGFKGESVYRFTHGEWKFAY